MDSVLILHGWGSCAKNWFRVKKLLDEKGIKAYIPDLPGFGESPPLSKPWSIDDYVEWVRKYSEKQNLSQFFLLGHSFGGSIAVKFTLNYPERIQKLLLVDTAGIRRKTLKKEIMKKISKFLKKFSFLPLFTFLKKIFYRIIVKSDYPYYAQGPMRGTYLNIISKDLSDDFALISVPTVLIWGKKDKITPLRDAYLIKEKVSGAKLEILSNIYHNPQTEAPKLLVEAVLKYL